MKAFTASLILCAVAAANAANSIKKGVNSVVDRKYIIEVESPSDIPSKRSISPHDNVYSALQKKGIVFTVDKEFKDNDLFLGASVSVDSADGLAALIDTPGIKSIRPVHLVSRPKPVKATVVSSKNDADVPPDTESTHKITGVDKLHSEGLRGKGVKIGILDTGTDYKHPDLGGGFGAGFKVAGGYDFVGDAYTGTNTPVPDNDPLDECAGHGTHVAGIIGANPENPFNISGVAYESSIYSYRIFGCDGSVQDDIIVDALLRGYKEGMDILTLSLGGVQGWTESASADVASKIAARGKIVTIAAGNDGAEGSWYTSSPGTGLNVISVASTDNTVISLQNATVSGVDSEHANLPYDSLLPLNISGSHELYATSTDNSVADDACSPLPSSTPDLSDKVVLIRRGSCTFVTKLTNAATFGAKYFLIDNNVPGFASVSLGNFTAALILPEDGQYLRSELTTGAKISLTFPQTGGYSQIPDPNGGLVSSFTTYGPTFDMYFKPAVAAPGGNILSTYPVPLGKYAVLSGTSMATPFMAGVSALLFQAKGKSAAVGVASRDLFQTTSSPVAQSHANDSLWETLTHQGSGLVNAYKAIHATTIVSPGQLLLNDTRFFQPNQKFTIRNNGKKKLTYTLGHVAAGTAITIPSGGLFPAVGPVPLVANAASVKFSESKVSINPGSSATITAHFTAPKGLNPASLPAYSGWITITSASDSSVVSYLGLAGTLHDKPVVDNTDDFLGFSLPAVIDASGNPQTNVTTYNFKNGSYPTLVYRLAFGTPRLTVDLVDANTTFTPTIKRASYQSVKVIGQLAENDYIPRNAETGEDNTYSQLDLTKPVFSNGTTIRNGSYKILLRALRVTGDAKNEAEYESYISPVINIAA